MIGGFVIFTYLWTFPISRFLSWEMVGMARKEDKDRVELVLLDRPKRDTDQKHTVSTQQVLRELRVRPRIWKSQSMPPKLLT